MTDAMKLELQRWGEFSAQRYVRPKGSEDGPGTHPLSRAREFAPETRAKAAKLLAGRDGRSRRTIAGGTYGIQPQWASDPIPCTETRSPGAPIASFDRGMPPEYAWVERGLVALQRLAPVQAAVVRTEFTVPASQRVKSQIVSRESGVGVSKSQYRRYLALGMAYLSAHRA